MKWWSRIFTPGFSLIFLALRRRVRDLRERNDSVM